MRKGTAGTPNFDFPWIAVMETTEITAILCDLLFLKSLEGFFRGLGNPKNCAMMGVFSAGSCFLG